MKKGIDVSSFKGKIDWENVKDVEFVIIRAAKGKNTDIRFEHNYAGCKKRSIPVGVYHAVWATDPEDAADEARYLLELLKGKSFEYPVYIDCETSAQKKLGKRAMTDIINAWLGVMGDAGYTAGVYTNPSWLKNRLYEDEINTADWWIAQWAESSKTAKRLGGMWQYSDNVNTEGIGKTDGDICYKDYGGTYYPAFTLNGKGLYDTLKAAGIDPSFGFRRKIANANGIRFYYGKASQNIYLLKLLNEGKLKRPV
ncbi:MAG: hypothetical protein J5760_03275 [Clostridia bacterium]|nr:hypothetical protein [Clostridia bacterium]